MENMEKKEETVVGENEIDVIVEKKADGVDFQAKLKKAISEARSCGKKLCVNVRKNKWMVLGAVVLLLVVAGSYSYKQYMQKIDIGSDAIKIKVEKFLTENVPATAKTGIKDIKKDGDLYNLTVTVDAQEIPIYVTRDGKKLVQAQGVIELDKIPDASAKQAQAPEKTEAENKTDVPTVDLFVMSYCPYGLQMEKGLLPAVEALGNKIKFNLKFVDYTLHGQKEVDENVNQYCIGKTQPTKLNNYLKCFWKSSTGTAAGCMKTVGINAATVAKCVTDTTAAFNPTEKAMGLDKEETVKFGVQGSPTLVINGTTVASGRDSASVLKAVCSGFTTQPKECQAKLSATSPSAGFDNEAAAAASGSAAPASCATN